MNCPAAVQERTAAREFFLALCDGPRSLLHGPFFVPKERENTMLESLEATLYPIVVNINNYLSSYILVFLLIAVGLWYSIRTRLDVYKRQEGAVRIAQDHVGVPEIHIEDQPGQLGDSGAQGTGQLSGVGQLPPDVYKRQILARTDLVHPQNNITQS